MLDAGHALVATHTPYFTLKSHESATHDVKGIHPDSPSGRLIADHATSLSHLSIEFIDPHAGRGGFGASSAQFLGVLSLLNKADRISELLDIFWQYHANPKPSGADIAAQAAGGLVAYSQLPLSINVSTWPFRDLELLFLATGHKVATHQHLATLNPPAFQILKKIAYDGIIAISDKDQDAFVKVINDYQTGLESLGLCAQHSQKIVKQLKALPETLACKGCGALGADVVMLATHHSRRDRVIEYCEKMSLTLIATSKELAMDISLITQE